MKCSNCDKEIDVLNHSTLSNPNTDFQLLYYCENTCIKQHKDKKQNKNE